MTGTRITQISEAEAHLQHALKQQAFTSKELFDARERAARVVAAFDRYMLPMEEGGPSDETWAEVKASIEALRE